MDVGVDLVAAEAGNVDALGCYDLLNYAADGVHDPLQVEEVLVQRSPPTTSTTWRLGQTSV